MEMEEEPIEEEEFVCSICLDILFQPVTTNCGHTFCKSCLNMYLHLQFHFISSLQFRQQCTICRSPILTSSHYLPVNIALQHLIERRYSKRYQKRKHQLATNEVVHKRLDNIPVLLAPVHVLPGLKTILTVSGRLGMDLLHMVSRGNRKFVIMAREEDMQGFVVELKLLTPTLVRN